MVNKPKWAPVVCILLGLCCCCASVDDLSETQDAESSEGTSDSSATGDMDDHGEDATTEDSSEDTEDSSYDTDDDGDGFTEAAGDCDDDNIAVSPIAVESCDGVDNDCNGSVDDGLTRVCQSDCGLGMEVCDNGLWTACDAHQPVVELCNNLDDDCDGAVDEDLRRDCENACGNGTERCVAGRWQSCSAPDTQERRGSVTVRSLIDGGDNLHIVGRDLFFYHLGGAFPGMGNGGSEPTYVNGEAWYPGWSISPSQANSVCNADSGECRHPNYCPDRCESSRFVLDPPFPTYGDVTVTVTYQNGRQSEANGLALTPGGDNPWLTWTWNDWLHGGAAWYEVRFDYVEVTSCD